MLIKCYGCNGKGAFEAEQYDLETDTTYSVEEKCGLCKGAGEIPIPDVHDVLEAYEDKNLDQLVKVYAKSLYWLTELEGLYNKYLLPRLDFQSRSAIDKQEKALLQESQFLRKTAECITTLKATLRACSFVLDLLKLQARTSKGVEI